jgi:hypothetical protein
MTFSPVGQPADGCAAEHPIECIVYGCRRVAGEELCLTVGELHLIYAVCTEHSCDRRRGSYLAAPEHANRGLIGLRGDA